MVLAAVFLLLHISGSGAHVSLTYPRAVYPQYDFLDNVRTGAPCGLEMGKPENKTTLVAGSEFLATFHLAYPHRGAFQFELLSCNGSTRLHDFTNGYLSNVTSTDTMYTVKVPNITCDCCYFRLIREAREWTGPSAWRNQYIFWSCAAVEIVQKASDSCDGTACSHHGKCNSGKCQCDRMWYGPYCQYKDACQSDSDCNQHGQCIDLDSTSPPAHQCFCEAGWHGPQCSKKSSLSIAKFNAQDYPGYVKAKTNLEYFYKFDKNSNELEVAIKYTGGEEWIGFGFRASGTTGSCRALSPGFYPTSASQFTPESEVESESEAEGETTTKPEGEGKTTAEGEGETNAEGEGETNAEGEGETNAEGEGGTNAEGEAGTGNLHSMDCTDIVISKVKGNLHRILDHYTRGRSTPQEDEWYGGQQSITAAVGQHVDGVTYIRFRKPARSSDKFDYDITDSVVNMIWAHGQVQGQYSPTIPPPSAGVSSKSFISDFYRVRELKYHGNGNGRGSARVNLVNPPSRGTSQNMIQISDQTNGVLYQATWKRSSRDSTKITFELQGKGGTNSWVGIGFSDDRQMPASDIITAIFKDSTPVRVVDRWASQKTQPAIDDDQSQIQDVSGRIENGRLYVSFTRTVRTTDSMDLSLDQPRYFLYAWGKLAANGEISYHNANKGVSNDKQLAVQGSETGGDDDDDEIWGIAVACVVIVLAVALGVAYFMYSRRTFNYSKESFRSMKE